jgi:hypothetical protein
MQVLEWQTMPYLFEQWGSTLAVVAGVCWFGYCFLLVLLLH